MSILGFLTEIISPVTKLVDEVSTNDEERGQLRLALNQLQVRLSSRLIDYEQRLSELRAQTVQSESQGHSWLQRNWRPITMMTFLVLVVADAFGWTSSPLNDKAWDLLELGLGGYVIGRSVEKITPAITEAVTSLSKNRGDV